MPDWIWVFHGSGSRFASGVFSSRETATKWIKERALSGVLTAYPLDEGVYDWAVRESVFVIKSPEQETSDFVQKFTSASQPHVHFEDGDSE